MEGPVTKRTVVNEPFKMVWQALIPIVTTMGCNIRTLDRDTGLLVFSKHLSKKEAKLFTVFPGGPKFMKKVKGGSVDVNAIIRPVPGNKTEIVLYTTFKVKISTLSSTSVQLVPSSGEFERRLFYTIKKYFEKGGYRYLL